jgi:uncharacterized protein (TIGR02996 family)
MSQPLGPTIVRAAAVLPGEAEMIASVLSNLREDAAKMVYADWLEQRGDLRGQYLRAFTTAARTSSNPDFPSGDAFPQIWRDVIGLTLIRRIREGSLHDRENLLLELARPVLTIDSEVATTEAFPLGASRFGGCPDLPRGSEWPTALPHATPPGWDASRCLPLRLLAQFNLADLAQTQAGRDLPPHGLLSFFVYKIVEYSWVGLAACLVLYTPDLNDLERLQPTTDFDESNQVSPPSRLTISEGLDIPDNSHPWEEKLNLNIEADRDRWEAYSELLNTEPYSLPWNNQLLGYTHPATLAGDPIGSTEWRHLATFVSNERELGWFWGDGDRLYFVISEADLRQRKFDHVRVEEG